MSKEVSTSSGVRRKVDEMKEYLVGRGYSEQTLRLHRNPFWRRLCDYAEAKGYHTIEETWVYEFLAGFLSTYGKNLSYNAQMQSQRSAHMICEFQEKGMVVRWTFAKREMKDADRYRPFYDAIEHYSAHNNLQESTKEAHVNEINKLVIFLEKQGVSFQDINAGHIREYLLTLGYHAKSTKAYCHFILRNLLKTVYEVGQMPNDLSWVCANIRTPQGRKIPSVYSPEEVEALINAIDRTSPIGKRDYAIILLAARLGLRVSDIRTLTFDNIDWVSSQIRLEQCKTEKDLVLPLSEEIGWAIIEYVKNARPATDSKCVFVRHTAPFEGFGTNNNLAYMIGKYLTRAGIVVPRDKRRGMHSLRHSLASNLLAIGTPLPVVSEVLGHSDTKTTSVYLKIDISQLRICALDADFGGDFA